MSDGVSKLLDAVVEFFESNEWPFSRPEGEDVLLTGYQGENGKWPCFAWVHEQQSQFVFYSTCPVTAPQSKHSVVAEFITRANYELILGNFEFDYDDGEVRFKTSIDVQDSELTTALVQQLVVANVVMMDRYLPGLMLVISSDISAKDAVAKVEGLMAGTEPTN